MPILEMETTLDISRQLNDTSPPAQFVTTCGSWDRRDGGVGGGGEGEGSKVTMTEGHAAGLRSTGRGSGLPPGSQGTMFALAWTHTALTLHLFVSFHGSTR